ncbi:expressed unknown protein [Seminavis robusta]|uniref:Uncharacterized protein n=1 Tax=Seminavis robusta TaxID=568900 RepID=A0A9N8HWB1_9STRA|nr:expressed unknown protein [Seminavis robusta]|eukprot:Sro2172_g317540.1 n/a (787) ;mRNA; f:9794-12154
MSSMIPTGSTEPVASAAEKAQEPDAATTDEILAPNPAARVTPPPSPPLVLENATPTSSTVATLDATQPNAAPATVATTVDATATLAATQPKILCFGMSYTCIPKSMLKLNVSFQEWSEGRTEVTPADVVKAVRQNLLTEMDGRDMARCIATEKTCQVDVFTVSQERAAVYDDTRHLNANFNRHRLIHQLYTSFATDKEGNRQSTNNDNNNGRRQQSSFDAKYTIRFRQAILDYYWIPQGWDSNHWSPSFFSDILVGLVQKGMLDMDGNDNNSNQQIPCAVYLPFCFHCFRQVVNALDSLKKYYAISFLRKPNDLGENTLWRGTQTIDAEMMQTRLGKRRDQEEVYCTFGYQEVVEAATGIKDETKDTLLHILKKLEDFDDIRFLKLRPLRQHHPTLTIPKDQHEKGGLKGLVDPRRVKRGFRASLGDSGDNSSSKVGAPKNEIVKNTGDATGNNHNKDTKKAPRTPRENSKKAPPPHMVATSLKSNHASKNEALHPASCKRSLSQQFRIWETIKKMNFPNGAGSRPTRRASSNQQTINVEQQSAVKPGCKRVVPPTVTTTATPWALPVPEAKRRKLARGRKTRRVLFFRSQGHNSPRSCSNDKTLSSTPASTTTRSSSRGTRSSPRGAPLPEQTAQRLPSRLARELAWDMSDPTPERQEASPSTPCTRSTRLVSPSPTSVLSPMVVEQHPSARRSLLVIGAQQKANASCTVGKKSQRTVIARDDILIHHDARRNHEHLEGEHDTHVSGFVPPDWGPITHLRQQGLVEWPNPKPVQVASKVTPCSYK